ncbi:hypothetical protein MNV49_004787 [Pseudohyphozyma bogoriensis]|nr:hypothetical protein MNV49_004787 [Pseudohyphozyma bogoriensis]
MEVPTRPETPPYLKTLSPYYAEFPHHQLQQPHPLQPPSPVRSVFSVSSATTTGSGSYSTLFNSGLHNLASPSPLRTEFDRGIFGRDSLESKGSEGGGGAIERGRDLLKALTGTTRRPSPSPSQGRTKPARPPPTLGVTLTDGGMVFGSQKFQLAAVPRKDLTPSGLRIDTSLQPQRSNGGRDRAGSHGSGVGGVGRENAKGMGSKVARILGVDASLTAGGVAAAQSEQQRLRSGSQASSRFGSGSGASLLSATR